MPRVRVPRKILYVEGCRDGTIGGSHSCLFNMVSNLDRSRYCPVVIFYDEHVYAEKLRNLGIEVHTVHKFDSFSTVRFFAKQVPWMYKIAPVFLPFQQFYNFSWNFIRPSLVYSKIINKTRPDIVHLNNSLNSNHEWILAAKIAGVKIISHERGISEKVSKTSKFFGRSFDYQICISKAIREGLIKIGLNERNMKVVYDGIDINKLQVITPPDEIKRDFRIGKNDPVIGIVGNVKQWKGQEIVIKATALIKKSFPKIKCLIVGGWVKGDPYKERLEKVISELAIKDNVIFTGYQKDPANLLNVMDIVVHSSIEPEPFGMVNLEAMCLEKPVISTTIGGPAEIFEDGKDGFLLQPGNPERLAEKVLMLLNNPELRQNIGKAARETVLQRFMISNTVRQVEEIYEAIIGK